MSILVGPAADSVRVTPVLAARVGSIDGVAPSSPPPVVVEEPAEAAPDALDRAVEKINTSLLDQSVGVRFEIDSETDQVVVKVVDRNSGELIRQMPSEEVLRIAKLMGKFPGVLMNQGA
jgi:flagellar protein FlaG